MKYIYLLTLLMLFIAVKIFGQQLTSQLISSAGQEFKNMDIAINFSIGEPLIIHREVSEIIISEGFQNYLQPPKEIVGFNENLESKIGDIYPNPAQNILYLNLIKGFDNVHILIYSINGKLVKNLDVAYYNDKIEIDIATLDKGIYLLKYNLGENNYHSNKFIKL